MLRRYLMLIALIVAFTAGYLVSNWHNDSVTLAVNRAAQTSREAIEKTAAHNAELLESKIAELRANEIKTETIIQREISKPIFTTVCVSDEFVELFNARNAAINASLSGKSINTLPSATKPDK